MKKSHAVIVVAGMIWLTAFAAREGAAQANPRGEASLGDGKITIEYGRPSVRGRDVLGLLRPGSYWRMGADSATTLKTEVDLKFGHLTVPKGSYSLVAHFVESDKWNLVVAKSLGEGYQPQDTVAEVPGELVKDGEHIEQLTIELEEEAGKASLVLSWSTYRLSADFEMGS